MCFRTNKKPVEPAATDLIGLLVWFAHYKKRTPPDEPVSKKGRSQNYYVEGGKAKQCEQGVTLALVNTVSMLIRQK